MGSKSSKQRTSLRSSKEGASAEVEKQTRIAPPSQYTFRIKNFSLLSKTLIQECKSCPFEVGGYSWNLILCPNGDKTQNVKDHISLYLGIADTEFMSLDWEVNVVYRFFLFDQIRDKYLTIGDVGGGGVRRFHGLKTRWGFPTLISLQSFKNPANGYLVDDTCEFGVEVYIVHGTVGKECLSLTKNAAQPLLYRWKIENFSNPMVKEDNCISATFTVRGHKWKIVVYPHGTLEGKDNSISLSLLPEESPRGKVYVEYMLRLIDQKNGKHITTKAGTEYFCYDDSLVRPVFPEFIRLCTFKDPKNGYLVDDTCIFEAVITILGYSEQVLCKSV